MSNAMGPCCRRTAAIVVSLLAAAAGAAMLAACNAAGGGSTAAGGSGGTGAAAKGEPVPFTLTATEDVAHRARAHIEAAVGGRVEATDEQRTRYRLNIAADSLPADMDITLTPLSSVTGVPGQTLHYAVDIQPAGTRLYDGALLEIIPATPLPKDVYWLENEGTAAHLTARPGFPAIGQAGVLIWHFSGGGVVGGDPATAAAMHAGAGADPGAVGSRSWLEWQRNVVQQDFQAGRIDQITRDVKNEIIDRRLQELTGEEIAQQLQQMADAASRAVDAAQALAQTGNLKDAQAIHDAIVKAYQADAQRQYLGFEDSDLGRKVGALTYTWYASLLRNCDNQRLSKEVLLGLERDMQLMGYEVSPAGFEHCAKLAGANEQQQAAMALSSGGNDKKSRAARKALVRRSAERVATYAMGMK